uniref:RBR-type E3 ubiquitin transferase n=1 Tax=Aegilops tauschii subsp. strangulata TaxID=200361 RepID=A0A453DAR1_AEGTS
MAEADLTGLVDDFYFSALTHAQNDADAAEDDELFPISDEKYAAELQLQEVIMSSAIAAAATSFPAHRSIATTSSSAVVMYGECSSAVASSSSCSGQPSSSSATATASPALVFCKICMDAVPESDAHRASRGCAHAFCSACLAGYIGAKIQDRIADVKCPEERCTGVLDPALCQGMLPREVFERWGAALCESMMLGAKRTYCPFKDCSAMMVADDDGGDVTQSECQVCRRLFCARCAVPWHAGADCAAYRKLGRGDRGKEDMLLLETAKQKKWKRCPKCEFFVEKTDGCLHITCRYGASIYTSCLLHTS